MYSGGVNIEYSNPTFQNVRIHNNQGFYGGGVRINNSSIIFADVVIDSNITEQFYFDFDNGSSANDAGGGGTGTGSAPVVAKYAMETEALVIGVAVLPFKEEGLPRRKIALQGLSELKKNCHCVIELDNENLNELTNGDCPMKRAFDVMSDLVTRTVRSLSEVITEPSTINVDFADLRKIIETGGNAKVLYGESENSDPGSVLDSLLGNPLLGSHYQGAEAVMLHITAKSEFSLNNCHEVLAALKLELSEDVNLIWGLRTDDSMDANVKVVMLVAAIPDSNMDVEKKSEEMIPLLGESVQMIN